MNSLTEDILRRHIERTNQVADEGTRHVQKVAATHIKIAERYIDLTDRVQDDLLEMPQEQEPKPE